MVHSAKVSERVGGLGFEVWGVGGVGRLDSQHGSALGDEIVSHTRVVSLVRIFKYLRSVHGFLSWATAVHAYTQIGARSFCPLSCTLLLIQYPHLASAGHLVSSLHTVLLGSCKARRRLRS